MRQTISGLVAAIAVVTVSTAPAMACGGGLFGSSCGSPCGGQAYVSSCGGHGGGYGYGAAAYEQLAEPTYYYANQGPTYSGPGMFAPAPTYQESAVSGWGAYGGNTYYGYDGGRYANATNHYYDSMPVAGPGIYGYGRPYVRPYRSHHYGYGVRPRVGYGYGARYGMRYGAAGYGASRYYGNRGARRFY